MLACFTAGILLPVSPLFRPVPSDDPSVYLYTANALLHGGTPYVSAWDHKQPLAYLIYALGLILTPHSLWGLWLLELIGLTAGGILCFRFLQKVAPRFISLLAVIIGLFTLYVILWGYSLEELAIPFQVLTLFAFFKIQHSLRPSRLFSWGLAIGAATGITFFLKQTLVAAAIAVGLYLVIEMVVRRSWKNLSALIGMGAGFFLVTAPLLAYLWQAGALTEYRNAAFGFNLDYAGLGPLERFNAMLDALEYLGSIPGLFLSFALWIICVLGAFFQAGPLVGRWIQGKWLRPAFFGAGALLVLASLGAEWIGSDPGFGLVQWLSFLAGCVLLLIAALVSVPRLRQSISNRLAQAQILESTETNPQFADQQTALWLCVILFPVLLGLITLSGRNYVYYFIPLIPFLMLSFGLLGGILSSAGNSARVQQIAAVGILGLGTALAYNPSLLIVAGYQAPTHPPAPEIAVYIQAHTTPEDTILVWGKETTYVYFTSQRMAPTRYFYQAPVSLEAYNAAHQVSSEILESIQAHPPRLFMELNGSGELPPNGQCGLPASDEPNSPGAIFRFICEHYQAPILVDGYRVYALNK